MSLTVTEGLTVTILPDASHEFLMTTKQVACGYGVTAYAIRMALTRHATELVEGKHLVKGITFCHTHANAQPHQIFWTKRGIVRLGFFIKSERAKLFRDWAEELIISVSENQTTDKRLPNRRNHNRLTPERLVRLLTLTNRISDNELRNEIVNELTGKEVYHA